METHSLLRRRTAQTLLVFILAVASAMNSQATTVRQLDLPELARQAEVIADVTVTGIESYWASPASGKAIHTRVTFSLN
jgi:hypothetical protein